MDAATAFIVRLLRHNHRSEHNEHNRSREHGNPSDGSSWIDRKGLDIRLDEDETDIWSMLVLQKANPSQLAVNITQRRNHGQRYHSPRNRPRPRWATARARPLLERDSGINRSKVGAVLQSRDGQHTNPSLDVYL